MKVKTEYSIAACRFAAKPQAVVRDIFMYYVYILKSDIDFKRYIGSTNDLQRRLVEHNSGRVKSTKHRRPLMLIYCEEYFLEKEAREREKYFKTHKGYNELKKILK